MNTLSIISSQKHIFEMLKRNKKKDRLSHAYLFYGEEGVGKKEMAYALASLFYCPNDGCLACETCNSILEGKHLNVTYVGILETKKLISKEQITELQEEFSKTSLVDGPRIYIVDGIDTASQSAQNSLLKFIEDPANTTPIIGIFIARELANVVSTIVSRCSLIHFPSIEVKQLAEQLKAEGIDDLDATLSSLLTNNFSMAKDGVLSPLFKDMKSFFLDFLNIRNKKQAVLFFVDRQAKITNESIPLFFKWLIAFYEDIFKVSDKEDLLLTGLYDKILMYLKVDMGVLKKQFSLILELYSKLDYNISAKNIFHELISKLF